MCIGQHPPLSSPPLKGGDKENKLLDSPLSLEAERTQGEGEKKVIVVQIFLDY